MSNQLSTVQNKINSIEQQLTDQAIMIHDMNQLMGFYFTYLSHYFPLLEFAVENLPENSIAKCANFGMSIDHILSNKINSVVNQSIDLTAKEVSEKVNEPKTEIIKLLEDVSIAQKVQISASLLMSSGITRDINLCTANSKFNALNKIIIWSNVFSWVIRYPSIAEIFVNQAMINQAKEDLKYAKARIEKKDRSYDYDLSGQWHEASGLNRDRVTNIPKCFVGAKLSWLKAMKGLHVAEYLLNNDVKSIEMAISYNNKLIKNLENKNVSQDEWVYRKMDTSGPSCNLLEIIKSTLEGEQALIKVVSSHTILIESKSKRFFVIVPGNFSFYVNATLGIKYNNNATIPLGEDTSTIINFYKSPADFFVRNLNYLSTPEKSDFYLNLKRDVKILDRLKNDPSKIMARLVSTFGDKINKNIAQTIEHVAKRGIDGIILYGLILGFQKIAKSMGFDVDTELWSETRTIIVGILISGLKPFNDYVTKNSQDEFIEKVDKVENVDSDSENSLTNEDKLRRIYEKIDEQRVEFNQTYKEMNEAGLGSLFEITNEIRKILLSGLSLEEINEELKSKYSII